MIEAWLVAHEALLPWLIAGSIASFVLTLIAVPLIVVALPRGYFARRDHSQFPWSGRHPLVWIPLIAAKNLVAATLVVLGVAMLVLPGQGLLTIAVGLLFLDFPGKYRLERWLISRPPVLRAFNRIRARAGREPFRIE